MATFHDVPLHSSPFWPRYAGEAPLLPVTDRIAAALVRLPLHLRLSEEYLDRAVSAVQRRRPERRRTDPRRQRRHRRATTRRRLLIGVCGDPRGARGDAPPLRDGVRGRRQPGYHPGHHPRAGRGAPGDGMDALPRDEQGPGPDGDRRVLRRAGSDRRVPRRGPRGARALHTVAGQGDRARRGHGHRAAGRRLPGPVARPRRDSPGTRSWSDGCSGWTCATPRWDTTLPPRPRPALLDEIRDPGWFWDTEFMVRAVRAGCAWRRSPGPTCAASTRPRRSAGCATPSRTSASWWRSGARRARGASGEGPDEIGFGRAARFGPSPWPWRPTAWPCSLPRTAWLRLLGAKIGRRAILHDVRFFNLYRRGLGGLHVGDDCFLGDERLLDLADAIRLEDHDPLAERAPSRPTPTSATAIIRCSRISRQMAAPVTIRLGSFVGAAVTSARPHHRAGGLRGRGQRGDRRRAAAHRRGRRARAAVGHAGMKPKGRRTAHGPTWPSPRWPRSRFSRGPLSGHPLDFRDLSLDFFPLRRFVLAGLQAGALRFWNPYVHEGEPRARRRSRFHSTCCGSCVPTRRGSALSSRCTSRSPRSS